MDSRRLAFGLLLSGAMFLAGCGASAAPAASDTTPTMAVGRGHPTEGARGAGQRTASPAVPGDAPRLGPDVVVTPAREGQSLEDLYRQMEEHVDFPLAAPSDVPGFRARSLRASGPEAAPLVELVLVGEQDSRRFLLFTQSPGGLGKVPSLGAAETVEVRGRPGNLEQGDSGAGPMVRLMWQQDGVTYLISGRNVEPATVVEVANSVESIR